MKTKKRTNDHYAEARAHGTGHPVDMSPIAQQAIRPAELKQALQMARSELVAEKRHVAEMARAGTRGVVQYNYEVVHYKNARQAQETRAEIAQWRKIGRREEQRRLARGDITYYDIHLS